jgi:hypothetical protein
VRKRGGLITVPSSALADTKPEHVKPIFDVTKEDGVYN